MYEAFKLLRDLLTNSLGTAGAQLRAAVSVGIPDEDAREAERLIDRDFAAWLHGDPAVTKNPASRYGERAPGYITSNGLGSLEIGAADD